MKPVSILSLVFVVAFASMVGGKDVSATASSDVEKLVGEGAAAFQEGRYKDALKRFQLADEHANGGSWDALAGAASASIQMGKNYQASEFAERMLKMDQRPNRRSVALHLLGVSLAGQSKLKRSEAALRESLALRRDRPSQTRTSLVAVLCRQGRHEEGLALLDDQGLCAKDGRKGTDDEEWEALERFEFDGGLTEPVKLSGATPQYPEQDRLARLEGAVVLDSIIGIDGSIRCVEVLSGPSPDMKCSAAVAVMSWKFQPSTLDGEPVDILYNLAVRFSLK